MARVFVEGDHEAFDRITTALRSAGLSAVDVEFVARSREVTRLPAQSSNWAALADLGADLSYTDWRDEVLSRVDAVPPASLRSASGLCETVVADLRRAG